MLCIHIQECPKGTENNLTSPHVSDFVKNVTDDRDNHKPDRTRMSDGDLRARLEQLQAENAALYARISLIKKQNKPEESPLVPMRKRDLGAIKAQLAEEEASRADRKAKLKELTSAHAQLEGALDRETFELEHTLAPKLKQEEDRLRAMFEKGLEFFRGSPQFEEIENLVKEFVKKQEQFEKLQDEIEKTEKMIGMNETEPDVVTGVVNSQAVPSFGGPPPAEEPPDAEDDSPLPCMSRKPRSLENARSRRRVSFQTGVLNM